jgi:predicted RNA-binding protein (virulence factor B family)
MLEIGKTASLEVLRTAPMGLILGRADAEVLLPTRYVPDGTSPGECVDVFVYRDSEDRPIATTERPFAQADEFAYLRVVSVNRVGAFLDWGLPKDLLLPFRSQLHPASEDDWLVVRVFCDRVSERLVASAKVERFLEPPPDDLRPGQPVPLLVYEETDLGCKAIVDGRFGGLLHRPPGGALPKVGSSLTGYVQRVREDGRVDLMLAPSGKAGIDSARQILLDALTAADGRLPLGDRSEPEEIRRTLGLSKKAFKRAAGALYRERRIELSDSSIALTEGESAPQPAGDV